MSETTINPAGRTRPARPQAVLAVQHREWLSPRAVRITPLRDRVSRRCA